MCVIRKAEPDDVAQIRVLLIETWHATYDHLYGVEKVNEIVDSWHSISALTQRITQPDSAFLVAQDRQEIVAVAQMSLSGRGAAHTTGDDDTIVMLNMLYVSTKMQRSGLG